MMSLSRATRDPMSTVSPSPERPARPLVGGGSCAALRELLHALAEREALLLEAIDQNRPIVDLRAAAGGSRLLRAPEWMT